jgi:hypothetical protein
MKRDTGVDLDKVARGLGAVRRGTVRAEGGWFGAAQLAADVGARFRAPAGGGRATDPGWTERRLLPLAPETLARLERLSAALGERGVVVTPLQVAALLLERAAAEAHDDEVEELSRHHRAS